MLWIAVPIDSYPGRPKADGSVVLLPRRRYFTIAVSALAAKPVAMFFGVGYIKAP
jgi:hypothetical protein